MPTKKKRYAVAGVSNRALGMFMDAIVIKYSEYGELVAMVDKDQGRMDRYNHSRKVNIPIFKPESFDEMVVKTKPDIVIVACQDSMHHHYIIKALKHDLDVISEKPLTIDEEKCAAIAKAESESKGKVKVTFNYRYTPYSTKIKELVSSGKVGKVVSVDLNWYVDTYHGSTYFQRWNRLRAESGGLCIHKSCHHLDAVQWWISQNPVEVFAYGSRNFYGSDGAHNPLKPEQIGDGRTCPTCDVRTKCKYYMRWNREELRSADSSFSKSKYYMRWNREELRSADSSFSKTKKIDDHVDASQEYEDYSSRQCIFDPEIDTEDTYSAVIKYDGGAFLNYSLNTSVPYEGFHLGINGTHGRIEFEELHAPIRLPYSPPAEQSKIIYIPLFGGREQIDLINFGGSHGGGDPLLQDELFIAPDPLAPVKRQADLQNGIDVVLTGVAIHKSIEQKRAIKIDELRR